MALRPSNKANPNFSMSSLTDIIFLLLIFFMLTSTFVTPTALNLRLPSSNSQAVAQSPMRVIIDNNFDYSVDGEVVFNGSNLTGEEEDMEALAPLKDALAQKISGLGEDEQKPTVVLWIDRDIPVFRVVQVMNVAKELDLEMILKTEKK